MMLPQTKGPGLVQVPPAMERRGYGKHIRDREPETEVQPIKLALPARTSTDR